MLLILMAITFSLTTAVDPTLYTYKTVGNINIEAVVYLPSTANLFPKCPVIMGIHGGGFISGYYAAFTDQEIEGFTSRGWCIVSIDYRLSPSALLQDIMEDVTDAYNWIRNDLSKIVPINPDIIVVWGGSAGGGLALMAGYKLTPRPQAIVAFYPYYANFTDLSVYDPAEPVSEALINLANSNREPILTEFVTDDPNHTRLQLFYQARAESKTGWFLTSVDPDESPEDITAKLKEYSVVYNIDEDYPPTYLFHGMLDNLTPYTQSTQTADQLEKYNVPYKLILRSDLGHGVEGVFATQWSKNMEPLLEFVEEEVGYIPQTTTKRHIVLIIVLSVVILLTIILGICLDKKLKLRQNMKSIQLVEQAECHSTSFGAKDSPSDTAMPESLTPEDEQVILELPKQISLETLC